MPMSGAPPTLHDMDSLLVILLVLVLAALGVVVALLIALLRRRDAVDLRPIETRTESVGRTVDEFTGRLGALGGVIEARLGTIEAAQREQGEAQRRESAESAVALQQLVVARLDRLAERIAALTDSASERQRRLQVSVEEQLRLLRQENERKLEQMRATVDEKLQSTLERRIGESFKIVGDRLEQVQKGLGEMQTLAGDVGGLKHVLTNVKNRGSWGEVQLSRQLEDFLAREQYDENVAITPGSAARVEFAVRLPGRDDDRDAPVYLPIDSKFPQEDYERLLAAQEAADPDAVEEASRALEQAIRTQAKTIASKYLDPPYSTDFAIMYLPTEGLFAEVIRRPGLVSALQREQHVMITGPTTLMSLLNSLQLGFRTLAIERRTSEVWQVLAAAKAEFGKFADVWQKLDRQLATAQNTVREAGTRTRAVERRLRAVDTDAAAEPSTDVAGAVTAPSRAAAPGQVPLD